MSKKYRDLSLALSGITQAANLVVRLANEGKIANTLAYETAINSIFITNPSDTLAVYGGQIGNLNYALTQLKFFLSGQREPLILLTGRIIMGLFYLERKLSKQHNLLQKMGKKLDTIKSLFDLYPATHTNTITKLDDLYQNTFSAFKYRIQVQGQKHFLESPDTAHKVRALLLAGVRSVVLWRQLGGTRLTLLFGRNKILREVNNYLS